MRIAAIGSAFAALILATVMVINIVIVEEVATTRFERVFPAVTADAVTVDVRIFGSFEVGRVGYAHFARIEHNIQTVISDTRHSDFPKKFKLMFQELIARNKTRGITIDSISYSIP